MTKVNSKNRSSNVFCTPRLRGLICKDNDIIYKIYILCNNDVIIITNGPCESEVNVNLRMVDAGVSMNVTYECEIIFTCHS